MAFDLKQDIYDHRQVGQPGKNGDAPKEVSISDNSVLNPFISSGPRKLNYRRLEKRRIFFKFFLF